MTRVWIAVALIGAATVVLKAAGPVLLGGRDLPGRVRLLVGLLAPALLGALVVTQTLASDRHVVVDARLAGGRPPRYRCGCARPSSSRSSSRPS